ncbi:23 kDa integral membrane protein [Drosophila grimshawi]|uniref:Tetraspanin n=1 Tax=Drosophila grimshawi TaxID=7222 RepID=B4J3W6_DROGR|nr:23 kDa integral membrane protein [Drosophila grimshawi]EDW01549.1 GH21497 [Drosophila grimshawi]
MGCMSGILNILLYIINIVFLIVGILLIVLGSIMLSNFSRLSDVEQLASADTIPICVTVLGGLIFIVSFFGCCGVWLQNACLTATYGTLMFLLFVLQLVLTCWIAVNENDFLNDMRKLVDTVWQENTAATGYPMGALELTFNCCGNEGYANYFDVGNGVVPGTCCGYTNRDQTCPSSIYESRQGCNQKFYSFWDDNNAIVLWSGLGICIYEFIVFILAGALANCMRKSSSGGATYG